MKTWRSWRPLGDADLAAARSVATQVVDDWSRAWFGLDACQVQRARIAQAPAWEQSIRLGEGLGCSGTTVALRSLVALALRGRAEPWPDHALALKTLEGFQRRLIEDLLRRLARALGQPDGLPLTEQPLAEGGQQMFVIEAGTAGRKAALVLNIDPAAIRRPQRLSEKLAGALSGRWQALGASRARLKATIGPIRLGALELMQLKPGDVLQAERSIYEPIDVQVGSIAVGRAYPCKVGQHLALQFSVDMQDGRDDGKR